MRKAFELILYTVTGCLLLAVAITSIILFKSNRSAQAVAVDKIIENTAGQKILRDNALVKRDIKNSVTHATTVRTTLQTTKALLDDKKTKLAVTLEPEKKTVTPEVATDEKPVSEARQPDEVEAEEPSTEPEIQQPEKTEKTEDIEQTTVAEKETDQPEKPENTVQDDPKPNSSEEDTKPADTKPEKPDPTVKPVEPEKPDDEVISAKQYVFADQDLSLEETLQKIRDFSQYNGAANYFDYQIKDGSLTVDGMTFTITAADDYYVTCYDPAEPGLDESTASGLPGGRGVCAAPPNIPFGTVVFIEGYGLCVVGDRGLLGDMQFDCCYNKGEVVNGDVSWDTGDHRVYFLK